MRHLAYIIACFVLLINIQLVNAQGDVKIGTQVWMTKNLDVDRFRNWDLIPEAKNAKEWEKLESETAAFCYYEYDSKNGKVYGKLYNWFAVNDSRGLAPKGYHIPSDAEWTILTEFLGGRDIAGKKMKSKDGWSDDGNGDNSSGFNGLPGGSCNYFSYFDGMADYGNWWSSSENDAGGAWERYLSNGDTRVYRSFVFKDYGLSVCCLRD